ncbi:unnamed protein product [Arctogadus glacialis]
MTSQVMSHWLFNLQHDVDANRHEQEDLDQSLFSPLDHSLDLNVCSLGLNPSLDLSVLKIQQSSIILSSVVMKHSLKGLTLLPSMGRKESSVVTKPSMKRYEDLGVISTEHKYTDIYSPDLLCSLLQSPPLRTRTFFPTPPL